MKTFFKNPAYQADFESKGYCIVPLLTNDELTDLRAKYQYFFHNLEVTGLYPTHSKEGYDLTQEINSVIEQILSRALENLLIDFQFFIAHFMVKSPLGSSEFPLHQDWSIVEESKYPVAQIWCPLNDTSMKNGGLFLIEESHRYFQNYRSGSLYRFHISANGKLKNYVKSLDVKAGEAVFYHNSLIHGSYPNNSDQMRTVVMASVTSSEAQFLYFHKNSNSKLLDVYTISKDIFLQNLKTFEKGGIPDKLPCLYSKDYMDQEIVENDILEKIQFKIKP